MKHFYLIGNLSKEGTCEAAQEIAVYLKQHGATCSGSLKSRNAGGHGKGYTDPDQVPPETECVITLGGDGTLIQAARDLIERQLPLIGINMGNLGYLTQIARGESVIPMLDALLTDNYRMETAQITDQLSDLSEKINEKTSKLMKLEDEYQKIDEDMKQIIRYSHIEKLTQEVVDTFIKRVYVYKGKRVEIEWSFRMDMGISQAKAL